MEKINTQGLSVDVSTCLFRSHSPFFFSLIACSPAPRAAKPQLITKRGSTSLSNNVTYNTSSTCGLLSFSVPSPLQCRPLR
jgi:hypothetical protein